MIDGKWGIMSVVEEEDMQSFDAMILPEALSLRQAHRSIPHRRASGH